MVHPPIFYEKIEVLKLHYLILLFSSMNSVFTKGGGVKSDVFKCGCSIQQRTLWACGMFLAQDGQRARGEQSSVRWCGSHWTPRWARGGCGTPLRGGKSPGSRRAASGTPQPQGHLSLRDASASCVMLGLLVRLL